MNINRLSVPLTLLAVLLLVGLSATRLTGLVAVGAAESPADPAFDEDGLPAADESVEDDEFSDDGFDDEESADFDDRDFDDEGFEDEDQDEDDFDGEDEFDDEDEFGDEDEDDRGEDDEDFDRRRRPGRLHREMEFEEEDFFEDEVISMEQMELAGWIGLELGPLDPAVAAHVSLEEGQGLMVYEVLPGSPAEASGVQRFDILLSVAGMPLQDVVQLREQISEAKDGVLSIELLRKGAKQQVQVTPGERPWNPDIFIPGSIEIPENVEVTISRTGSGPLTVTVREGDQTWTASSEEEFEQLPERVVMWLFETMNEFMPFDEEEDWEDEWGDDEWSEEIRREFEGEAGSRADWMEEEEFRRGDFDDEEDFGPDPLEERINALEGKIDRILGRLQD